MIVRRLLPALRDGHWLTRDRVIAGGQIMLLVELSILVFLALWQHGVIAPEVSKTSSDFVSFYAAGKLALAGTPALAYDQAAHFAMEQHFTVPGAQYQYFFYPPIFILLCAPLSLLPYHAAYYVFEIVTLAAFLLTMRQILREPGWTWLAPVLAFPAIFWTMGLGQNAFLTAALFGWFTLLAGRRPVLAGLVLGLLCYKPHFGLLAPAALACGGHWRAFFAAGAAVAVLVLLSTGLFGVETWQAYLSAFASSDAVYASGRIDYAGMVTPFGAVRLLGFSPSISYVVQTFVTGSMVLLMALVWRVERRPPLRAAALLPATMLAVPMALLYDQLLLLVAIGWLVRDGRQRGFLPWEKTVLMAAYPLCFATWLVGSAWQVPLGPIVSLAVLCLSLRRIKKVSVPRPEPVRAGGGMPMDVIPAAGR